ncbi:hypothetical protein GGR42_003118 [Saonia flava]|uniref:Uncharacterized protein n=1 Tax=Saonia flava TaxID=523696 RepID=A0A846QZK2_9FLAO|nr:hypothetical protein [Saonia flava]NJB72627.1 hypothetical protein [Saonia flava]
MKNRIFITIGLCLLSIWFMSAQQNQLTGPEAKNRKPWENPRESSIVMVKNHNHKPLTGPKAKNLKLWEDKCERIAVVYEQRKIITGPKAKNTRPEHDDYWASMESSSEIIQ